MRGEAITLEPLISVPRGRQKIPEIAAGPRGPRKTVVDIYHIKRQARTRPDAVNRPSKMQELLRSLARQESVTDRIEPDF
jgi:hypothetical protein